jgi:thymidylate synthase
VAEFTSNSMDGIFKALVETISEDPRFVCSPRGQKVKEILACTFELTDPRRRVVWNPARETNHGFACGEFLWYWQGRQDLEMMLFYNKRMKDFSDDGKTLNSAYGHRLKNVQGRSELGPIPSQWETCVKTLNDDPDSRRAVMLINRPMDEVTAAYVGSKDVPCTLSLQFFIRDGKLNLHTVMRSNDVMWGLTYDAFSFTMFQECMLLDLERIPKFKDLGLGSYYHTAGSMHMYERHFEQAKRIIAVPDEEIVRYEEPMAGLTSLEDLDRLCKEEELIRTQKRYIDTLDYNGTLNWMAGRINSNRCKRDMEESYEK